MGNMTYSANDFKRFLPHNTILVAYKNNYVIINHILYLALLITYRHAYTMRTMCP